jgi:hypothetical protein
MVLWGVGVCVCGLHELSARVALWQVPTATSTYRVFARLFDVQVKELPCKQEGRVVVVGDGWMDGWLGG